jgi:hypothetical protein
MTAPTRATTAGRAYLDLRRRARQDRRPVDELMQLYVLESFVARMSATRSADEFVLKGGVLLAVFGNDGRPATSTSRRSPSAASPPRSGLPSPPSLPPAWTTESSSTRRPPPRR